MPQLKHQYMLQFYLGSAVMQRCLRLQNGLVQPTWCKLAALSWRQILAACSLHIGYSSVFWTFCPYKNCHSSPSYWARLFWFLPHEGCCCLSFTMPSPQADLDLSLKLWSALDLLNCAVTLVSLVGPFFKKIIFPILLRLFEVPMEEDICDCTHKIRVSQSLWLAGTKGLLQSLSCANERYRKLPSLGFPHL